MTWLYLEKINVELLGWLCRGEHLHRNYIISVRQTPLFEFEWSFKMRIMPVFPFVWSSTKSALICHIWQRNVDAETIYCAALIHIPDAYSLSLLPTFFFLLGLPLSDHCKCNTHITHFLGHFLHRKASLHQTPPLSASLSHWTISSYRKTPFRAALMTHWQWKRTHL